MPVMTGTFNEASASIPVTGIYHHHVLRSSCVIPLASIGGPDSVRRIAGGVALNSVRYITVRSHFIIGIGRGTQSIVGNRFPILPGGCRPHAYEYQGTHYR